MPLSEGKYVGIVARSTSTSASSTFPSAALNKKLAAIFCEGFKYVWRDASLPVGEDEKATNALQVHKSIRIAGMTKVDILKIELWFQFGSPKSLLSTAATLPNKQTCINKLLRI
jgi:hypothetical protein